MLPRMRTIPEAAAELRRIDPDTAITEYFIRCMVLDGTVAGLRNGRRRFVNLDALLDYLDMSASKPGEDSDHAQNL